MAAAVEEAEVPKHTVETLTFRSVKRARDFFLSDHGKAIPEDEERYVKAMDQRVSEARPRGREVLGASPLTDRVLSFVSRAMKIRCKRLDEYKAVMHLPIPSAAKKAELGGTSEGMLT